MKELHKITSILRKDIRSWLAKQALWQVHIPPPKKIHHPHYNMAKPNEQHQFDLLYMPHNVFEGNTYKFILTDIDVALRYKVARPLWTKKSSEVAFALEAIYKKGGVFKHPKAFQCDNGPEIKNEVTKLLEKHDVDIQEQQRNKTILKRPLWKPLIRSWQNCCLTDGYPRNTGPWKSIDNLG